MRSECGTLESGRRDSSAHAMALVDRFGGDIGKLARLMALKVSGPIDYSKIDPSQCKDLFEDPTSYDEAWDMSATSNMESGKRPL